MPDIQTIASLLAKPNTSNENYLDREEKRRLLAFEQIQKLASDTKTPIYSTSAGVLKLATGALGGYLEGKTERDAQAAQAQNSALQARWLNLLSGGGDPGATPAPVSPPAIDTSDVPASPVSAPPMGALPGFGPVADSSPPFSPQPSVGDPFPANKIYDPGEMTPLDAAVATPEERAAPVPFQHVPDAPRIVPIPSAPAVDGSLAFASPMSPAVPPGGLDQGTVFNPSLPGGLSEGSTVLPNATVKPVSIGPNGEVSSLAPSGPFANDPVPRPPADIPNPMPQYANAISGIESGGRYDLIGPATRGGDRAIGKYQVMASNVPEWTKEALGKSMTPAEFRADPQAQEAVFAHKFGSYVQKYGPEGAAKAWFAGEGGMKNPNARDVLGTSVSSYARQFRNNLGPAGAQVASLDPRAGVAASQPPAGASPVQSGPSPQRLAQALQNPPQVNQDAQLRAVTAQLLSDPRTPPQVRAMVIQQMMPQNQFMQMPDGTVLSLDKRTNKPTVVYEGQTKPTSEVQNYEYSLKHPGFVAYQKGATAKSGLTPIYGQDSSGKTVLGVMNNDGTFRKVDTGDFTPQSGVDRIDLGTHYQLRDHCTGVVVGDEPKDLRGAEREKEVGEAQGKALASAPADIQSGQNALDLIGKIRKDPYLERGTGFSSVLNSIPGTGGHDFANVVEQAKSGAFLQAIQQMRGLGSLSNAEGGAATAAITRMNTSTSTPAFLDALSDYEKIIKQGMSRAQSRLDNPSATNPSGSSATTKRLRFNPATGALE